MDTDTVFKCSMLFYGHGSRSRDTDLWGQPMPAIASLEDLKAAQKDLQEAKDLNELKGVFKKYRRIGWKNVCGAPRTSASQHT